MQQYTISTRVRGKDRSARTNDPKKVETAYASFLAAFVKDGGKFFTFTVRADEYSSPEAAPAETF